MNGKCSLGAMNGNIQFIGLIMLACIAIIVAIYYFRDVNVKHSKILEKYTIPDIPANQKSEITNHNYGVSHNAGTSATDLPKYSNRKIISRDCQVYFANESACDSATSDDKKCKYQFKDGWKEISQISDPLNNNVFSTINKKVYNQNYTRKEDEINNFKEMTACFKKVDNANSKNVNRFVYDKNSLVNYGYGGTGELISLNVDGKQGNYISMYFNNDNAPATNYGHIIDSISSLQRSTIPSIATDKKFLRLKLDDSNYITHFERVTINSTQTGFDIDNTFDVTNMIASGTNGKEYVGGINGNTFRCFSITSSIPNSRVQIYRFNFNLLNNTPQALSYSIHDAEVNIGGIINMDTLGQDPKEFDIAIPGGPGNLGNLINRRYYDNTIKGYDKWSNPINSKEPKTDRLTYINIDLELMKAKRFEELAKELEDEAKVPCDDYCDAQSKLNEGVSEQATYSLLKDAVLNLFTLDKGYAFYTTDVTLKDKALPEDDNIINQRQVEVDGDTIEVEPTLTNAGNIRPNVIPGTTDYKYFTFTNNGTNQTSYTINFTEPTICDILIVGGGGAGGNSMGGGGGAGGLVYTVNQTLSGTYVINVGKGGAGKALLSDGQGDISEDGIESSIQNTSGGYVSLNMGGASIPLRGFGGGGGAIYYDARFLNGRDGGSGGGCTEHNPGFGLNTPGSARQGNTYWNGSSYVAGGKAGRQNTTTSRDYQAGGGGGAGAQSSDYTAGNNGVSINITGNSTIYAAGGGAGQYKDNSTPAISTSRGFGGSESVGGNGRIWNGFKYIREATSGRNGTGSGGGGGAYAQPPDNIVGSGGSGIVIIRVKMTGETIVSSIDFSKQNVLA
jgi:hypothetical protein